MTLDRYLLRQYIPVFLVALAMFVVLLSLIDLFANLWRYLAYEAPGAEILKVAYYYLPKCVSYALPISLLFASAYTIGQLYSQHELTVVFISGIPLWRFTSVLLLLGALLSLGSFFFEDRIVIPQFALKKELSRTLLKQKRSGNNSDIVVKSNEGRLVYAVDFYNDIDTTLNGLSIIERDPEGNLLVLIRARKAFWDSGAWRLENATKYAWERGLLISKAYDEKREYTESPAIFRRSAVEVEELSVHDAHLFIADLRSAGLPYYGALADYYKRFAFSVTPLVVLLLSIPMGGRYRKNILLMSLLSSLMAAVLFYVTQMLTMMLAKLGYIPAFWGAWSPVFLFVMIGSGMVRSART